MRKVGSAAGLEAGAEKQRAQPAESASTLVEGLTRPEAYAHRPHGVDLRQTHISWVFLAGDWVYKVKKPVRFAFLDYSTPERRLTFCREEVRLNRRLAPDVYTGVVPILAGPDGLRVAETATAEGHEPVVEHAVRMRRLPAEEMLDVRLREGTAGSREIRELAARLVEFHAGAPSDAAERFGAPEAVLGTIRSDLLEMRPFLGPVLTEGELDDIDRFYRDFFEAERAVFARRLAESRIREGHGDLRAEHVCLIDPLVVFDCVEFSERLRTADVASEIAFLAMDLDFLGEPGLARELVSAYAADARDDGIPGLLPFYACYRACVRGKVDTLKSLEEEVPEPERLQARLRARRYFRLARRFAFGAPRPALVVVCGVSGTGKTTVARLIAAESGFPLRRSDVVRKRLAGLRTTDRPESGFQEGLYSPEASRRTYEALRDEAEASLRAGSGAIVEATFLEAEHRLPFVELAARCGTPVLFVECRASDTEVRRRLEARRQDPEEASDAGVEIYLRQLATFEPLDDVRPTSRLTLDTERELDDFPTRLRRALGS